jgi:hypothetical protein
MIVISRPITRMELRTLPWVRLGVLNFSVLGGRHMMETKEYLSRNSLPVDYRGERYSYELIVTSSDLIVQKNIRGNRMVLVQEGITEPETRVHWMVKWLKLHILVGLDTYRNQRIASGMWVKLGVDR